MEFGKSKIFPPGSPLAKFKRKQWIILIIVLFVCLCIAFWITYTGKWPAPALIKFETERLGWRHYFRGACALIWVIMVIAMAIVARIIGAFNGKK